MTTSLGGQLTFIWVVSGLIYLSGQLI